MVLIYKNINPNGTIELQYSKSLSDSITTSILQWLQIPIASSLIKLSAQNTKLTISPKLLGGKGAFRQLMRNVGRTTNKSNNQSMARDLSGRRIRDVENEKRLQDFIDSYADREFIKDKERKAKLEKLAKIGKDELIRKNFMDSNFDIEAEEMETKMSEAVSASLEIPANCRILKRPLDDFEYKGESSLSKNSENAKKPKVIFGLDEEDVSSDEETAKSSSTLKNEIIDFSSCLETTKENLNAILEEAKEIEIEESKKKQIQEEKVDSGVENATKSDEETKVVNYKKLNLKKIKDKSDLEKYSGDHLKHELNRRGLKSGGTLEQKIHRLFFVKNKTWQQIPKKFKNPLFLQPV